MSIFAMFYTIFEMNYKKVDVIINEKRGVSAYAEYGI